MEIKPLTVSKAAYSALKAAISHWQANVLALEQKQIYLYSNEGDACPLCHMFYMDCWEPNNEQCPIARTTGRIECDKTPWNRTWRAEDIEERYAPLQTRENLAKALSAAKEELTFLNHLLSKCTTE